MIAPLVTYLKAKLGVMLRDDSGQTIVEYVLLIVLVGLAVFFASPSITKAVINTFSRTSSVLNTTT